MDGFYQKGKKLEEKEQRRKIMCIELTHDTSFLIERMQIGLPTPTCGAHQFHRPLWI
jgi:ABC-type Co2+ transport system permease subunit